MITRRNLVRGAAVGALAAPFIVPSRAWGSHARLRIGQFGCGRIALSHDMPGVIKSGLADYVAVCDLDSNRVADGVKKAGETYTERGIAVPKIATFENYREMLGRRDIDAVVISTPDHWHAEL